jgi:NTE family protein
MPMGGTQTIFFRNFPTMKIGLSLSGGGAKGIAHLGVIQALDEMGVKFSILSGASSGAVAASLYSYGYPPREILTIIKKIKTFRSLRLAWGLMGGMLGMGGMKKLILDGIPEDSFSALKIPVIISTTNLKTGRVRYFSEGALADVIAASCCVPAIFSPVIIEGEPYIDGGVVDNLPVTPIVGRCDFIIGSNCNPISQNFIPKNIKKVIERTMIMAINPNTMASKALCQVYIEPPGLSKFAGTDLNCADEIFDIGYTFTKNNFSPSDFPVA